MESYGILWNIMDSHGILWILMDSYEFSCIPMDSYGIPWILMEYHGFFMEYHGFFMDSQEFSWTMNLNIFLSPRFTDDGYECCTGFPNRSIVYGHTVFSW